MTTTDVRAEQKAFTDVMIFIFVVGFGVCILAVLVYGYLRVNKSGYISHTVIVPVHMKSDWVSWSRADYTFLCEPRCTI